MFTSNNIITEYSSSIATASIDLLLNGSTATMTLLSTSRVGLTLALMIASMNTRLASTTMDNAIASTKRLSLDGGNVIVNHWHLVSSLPTRKDWDGASLHGRYLEKTTTVRLTPQQSCCACVMLPRLD